MKKLFIAVVLCLAMSAAAKADVLTLDLKYIKFDVQGNLDAVGMFNVFHQTKDDYVLPGIQTSIGNIPIQGTTKLDLNVGSITGAQDTGATFVSLCYTWNVGSSPFLEKLGLTNIKGGLGAGWNANNEEDTNGWHHCIGGLVISANVLSLGGNTSMTTISDKQAMGDKTTTYFGQ